MLDEVDGVTASDDTCSVLRVAVPVIPLETAVIVVVPVFVVAVARPRDPTALLMVATLISVEFHVAVAVIFCMLPFENVPMAMNCAVVPGAMLESAGVIDTETSVAEGVETDPVDPPQPCRKTAKSAIIVARMMLIHDRNFLFMMNSNWYNINSSSFFCLRGCWQQAAATT
jgi:hypothetical protein